MQHKKLIFNTSVADGTICIFALLACEPPTAHSDNATDHYSHLHISWAVTVKFQYTQYQQSECINKGLYMIVISVTNNNECLINRSYRQLYLTNLDLCLRHRLYSCITEV